MQVSDSSVATPATCPGILNFLFRAKRISHRGIDEVYLFVGLYLFFFTEYVSKMGNGPVTCCSG